MGLRRAVLTAHLRKKGLDTHQRRCFFVAVVVLLKARALLGKSPEEKETREAQMAASLGLRSRCHVLRYLALTSQAPDLSWHIPRLSLSSLNDVLFVPAASCPARCFYQPAPSIAPTASEVGLQLSSNSLAQKISALGATPRTSSSWRRWQWTPRTSSSAR